MLKSKPNIFCTMVIPALLLATLSCLLSPTPARAVAPQLPVLNWQQRSDWINVKTNVTPAAFGDGRHDDTAAIQAAMNIVSASQINANNGRYANRTTVYLPAGTYRITKTLKMTNIYGAQVIGQGRGTRILWNGPRGQQMYVSDGVTRSRYVGIIWDGAGRASVGINHAPHTVYETCIRHQDEAFINFIGVGVRVGNQQILPTSEMTFQNCLFQKCGNGVAFLSWNDYNNNFEGCEFQDNGTGINCDEGNVYVRDCHFERSSVTDLILCSQDHSVRRCTSVGSKQFIFVAETGSGCSVTAQDCHVDGWTGGWGAMLFGMRGPTTIFDCSFTHPPDSKPPVRLVNYGGLTQLMIVSNNSAPDSQTLVDPGPNSQVSVLPAGAHGPSLSDPSRSFFKSSRTIPSAVLDVKTQFGAKGDGSTDDTAAILNALNAARTQGGGVEVYFPAGQYNVSQTLPITGSNYSVEGSGFATILRWTGPHGGVVCGVQDPRGVALKGFMFETPLDTACVQQTSTGSGLSSMTYERIWTSSHLVFGQSYRSLECVALPSSCTVQMDDFYGGAHFTDCSRATILSHFGCCDYLVEGAHYEKTGFLGVLANNNAESVCDVVVRDNQDFVGTNFYTESTRSALCVSGDGALPGQPGHVTIQGARVQTFDPTCIKVNDYEGRVTYAGAGLESSTAPQVSQTGARPLDIVLLGNTETTAHDDFTLGSVSLDRGGRLTVVGNYCANYSDQSLVNFTVLPNVLSGLTQTGAASALSGSGLSGGPPAAPAPQAALAPAVAALDDFRLLGEYDLALNYP